MATSTSDVPVPSIETDFDSGLVARASPTPGVSTDGPPTPTASTPSTAETDDHNARNRNTESSNSNPNRTRAGADGIINGLSNMRLSPPGGVSDMTGLAEAIDAAGQRSERANSLAPTIGGESPDPESARSRRRSRRASSQPVRMRHEVCDEELPPDAVHSPEFRQAFQSSKQLMSNMEAVLGSSTLHNDEDSTICRLYREAVNLAAFQYPSTRIVGFVGDSGVGGF